MKTLEKAIKNENFAEAKTAITQAETLMSAMDEKSKAKFYYLKGQALYANGKGSIKDIVSAIENLNKVEGAYGSEVKELKQTMSNGLLTKGNKAYEKKDYSKASKFFESAYRVTKKDTLFLYYAAATAVNVKEYDRALNIYEELKALGYTGISKEYYATEKATGKEVVLDKKALDFYVKTGSHVNPGERLTESKKPEIVKNVALIYIANGDKEKALAAIKDASTRPSKPLGNFVSIAEYAKSWPSLFCDILGNASCILAKSGNTTSDASATKIHGHGRKA